MQLRLTQDTAVAAGAYLREIEAEIVRLEAGIELSCEREG